MKEDAAEAVKAWLPKLGLPDPPADGSKDLKGKFVRVARFADEAAVRFFFPRRSLIFQQRMVKTLVRQLHKRGAKIDTVQMTAEDYARWLDGRGLEDTPERRYDFATAPPIPGHAGE